MWSLVLCPIGKDGRKGEGRQGRNVLNEFRSKHSAKRGSLKDDLGPGKMRGSGPCILKRGGRDGGRI